jgi:tellurite resistance protein
MIQSIRDFFSPEQRRVIGAEAKQALENRHWNEALVAVEGYLVESAKSCDPDSKEKSQRIVISLQLLEAIKRELVRKIEDGEMARIEIQELERRKRPLRFER